MLKPVIVLNGSDENSGNFFYEGSYNDKPFVVQLNLNGSCKAITADYPKYVVKGSYFYDSSDQTAVLNPSEITCPSCSWWENLGLDLFADVPDRQSYAVLTFGADYIDLKDQDKGSEYHLVRVEEFSLGNEVPTKDFTLEIMATKLWIGNTIFGILVPENLNNKGHISTSTVGTRTYIEFSIPKNEFHSSIEKYYLFMGIVTNINDIEIDLNQGTIAVVTPENVLATTGNFYLPCTIQRDVQTTSPVQIPFIDTMQINN
jgi:hypothetical protein